MPEYELNLSIIHSKQSDLFIVIGSSLKATPASNLPVYALQNNAKLVIINKMETHLDKKCALRFYESAGRVLDLTLKIIKKII